MSSLYDQNRLEEELSRVNCPDEDLDFEYLFEYEAPYGSEAEGGRQGWWTDFGATTPPAPHHSLPLTLMVGVGGVIHT